MDSLRSKHNKIGAKAYLKTSLGRLPIEACTVNSPHVSSCSRPVKLLAGLILDYFYYNRFDVAVNLISKDTRLISNSEVRALDIGCANGDFITLLSRFLTTRHIIGLDSNPSVAQTSEFEVVTAKAPPLPFPDSHFDLITCLGTTEHVVQEQLFVKEVSRALKPEGIYLCLMPIETGFAGLIRHIVKNITYPNRPDCKSIFDYSLDEIMGKCPRDKHGRGHKYYNYKFLVEDLYSSFRKVSLHPWPEYLPKGIAPELFALCVK